MSTELTPAAYPRFFAISERRIFGFILPAVALAIFSVFLAVGQVSLNFYLFVCASLGLILALTYSYRAGVFYSLFYFALKPAVWRLAYHFDSATSSHPSVDLLRFSGGIFLILICLALIAKYIVERRKFLTTRLELVLTLFGTVAFLSILNPLSSPVIGLAGFERNIFPTMFLFFVGREVIRSEKDLRVYLHVSLVVAIIAVLYGLRHSFVGLWSFEKTFFNDLNQAEGLAGWLTIGLKGVEFRPFSTFFSYTEFTFTLALWAILFLSLDMRQINLKETWYKPVFVALCFLALAVSLERTPIVMIAIGLIGAWFVRSGNRTRKRIIVIGLSVFLLMSVGLSAFQKELEDSGISKLERISELADPTSASSIQDRVERKWTPAMKHIAANPLGNGIGSGSGTIVSGATIQGDASFVEPHNEFLQKTLETGWPGGILYVSLMILLLLEFKRRAERRPETVEGKLSAAGFGILVAFLLCGMINLPFSGASGNFFWFTAGGILSMSSNNRNELNKIQK